MKRRFISTFVMILFLLSISLTLFISPAKAAVPKIQFQYILFPTSVFTDSVIDAGVCFVNQGAAGPLIYDGTTDFDEVSISVPVGIGADKLILDSSVLSYNTSADWSCTIDTSGVTGGEGEFLLIFRPNDTQSIAEGETICFDISGLIINSEVGLALLYVDQQFDPSRSEKEKNGSIGVFKTADISGIVEIDPTVNEDIKDGVDFTEVTGTATDTQIPDTITINNADMVDDKHYSDISQEIDGKIDTHKNALGHLTIDQKTDLTDGGDTTLHHHAINACSSGYSIRQINPDGTVVCEPDTDTDTHLSKSTVQQWANEVDDGQGGGWVELCMCGFNQTDGDNDWALTCPDRCVNLTNGWCHWRIKIWAKDLEAPCHWQ